MQNCHAQFVHFRQTYNHSPCRMSRIDHQITQSCHGMCVVYLCRSLCTTQNYNLPPPEFHRPKLSCQIGSFPHDMNSYTTWNVREPPSTLYSSKVDEWSKCDKKCTQTFLDAQMWNELTNAMVVTEIEKDLSFERYLQFTSTPPRV